MAKYAKKNPGKKGTWRYVFLLNGKTFTGGPFDDDESASVAGQLARDNEIKRLTKIRGYGELGSRERIDQGEVDMTIQKRSFTD